MRPALGHVNLMADTYLANVQLDDLRKVVRDLLASGLPGIGPTFCAAARARIVRQGVAVAVPEDVFENDGVDTYFTVPTDALRSTMVEARCLYGSGMGFAAIRLLSGLVRQTLGRRWRYEGSTMAVLNELDIDITQAIQSSKEEMEAGRVANYAVALEFVQDLRCAIAESRDNVESWGGEFPFERAEFSVEFWHLPLRIDKPFQQETARL
ncbi:hypothetical protein CYLTODRAFT_352530 [Cylindrobasidium torrendii FP15055 ss-10]|uniref:Uncharacterized protein n=1 Tax=Cylindrobasidium torrendii FP15055 ss-10 TaxID=1314674 RepID=A0A0D7BCA0_9AGAR|nr:hypothetical protein CYLTODRAFT_352530 [Cylindrobasidium torrendii FP15055 ss-10]